VNGSPAYKKFDKHMTLLDIFTFAGHLHPLIVHLPIGFILLGAIFDICSYSKRYSNLQPAVSIALLMGFISAIMACVFGYVLSLSGEYDDVLLRSHGFSGLILAIISGILYFARTGSLKKPRFVSGKWFTVLLLSLVLLMSYSGHLGASLTHGSDYITMRTLTAKLREKPTSIDSAMIFEDIIQPILQNKCMQCHRQGKLKGNLSVESLPNLLKGGKNGPAIVAGNAGESELYKRVTLDPDNKDYMPKDGKTPLTANELKLIKWWIEKAHATSGKRMAEFKEADTVRRQLALYLGMEGAVPMDEAGNSIEQVINPDIPLIADTLVIGKLRQKGLMVRYMLKRPLMLDITLPAGSGMKAAELKSGLLPLAKNIIWLNLSSNNFTDRDISFLQDFSNLEKLRLDKNPLSDEISNTLSGLKHLESVNLRETKITDAAVINLKKNFPARRVYTWGTAAAQKDGLVTPTSGVN
jgi:uncharacterized membrane protein